MNNPAKKATLQLQKFLRTKPRLAIVLGSGFDGIVRQIEVLEEVAYESLPGFSVPTIEGHPGKLLLGRWNGVSVLVLRGRVHYYEGHSMETITFPIRVVAELGVQTVLLTNAAGGINPRFLPGDFMCLTDHINFMGVNPLRVEHRQGEPCFVDLTEVYDRSLIQVFRAAARRAKVRLHLGVYIGVSGPAYETPAEIRAFAKLGADAVGMSAVPEAIVARQCGLRVVALCCITNRAAGTSRAPISHVEVLAMGKEVHERACRLLRAFVGLLPDAS